MAGITHDKVLTGSDGTNPDRAQPSDWNADHVLPDPLDLTGTLNVDTIDESTADAGVTVDGVLLKDDDITATDGDFSGIVTTQYVDSDGTDLNLRTDASQDIDLWPGGVKTYTVDNDAIYPVAAGKDIGTSGDPFDKGYFSGTVHTGYVEGPSGGDLWLKADDDVILDARAGRDVIVRGDTGGTLYLRPYYGRGTSSHGDYRAILGAIERHFRNAGIE